MMIDPTPAMQETPEPTRAEAEALRKARLAHAVDFFHASREARKEGRRMARIARRMAGYPAEPEAPTPDLSGYGKKYREAIYPRCDALRALAKRLGGAVVAYHPHPNRAMRRAAGAR